ncbi:Arginine decarboxylase 2 [Forsythia ovata]|uniref:Arginine decarboxylase n=1 Tax=Forsythia ovata TaxID=205694 RepID=A0ABD1RK23_9LAMI
MKVGRYMPALACCVYDYVVPPPGYAFAEKRALPMLKSAALYQVEGWGAPYFSFNSSDNILIRPHGVWMLAHQDIDLLKVVKKVSEPKSSGGLRLQLPLIVRFPNVLKNWLEYLQLAFNFAIQSHCYEAHYQGVYVVKCNQDR